MDFALVVFLTAASVARLAGHFWFIAKALCRNGMNEQHMDTI
jgi:hypothetical protein